MASVLDVPALQGPPDVLPALQMLSQGLADRVKRQEAEKQKLLAQTVGGQLSQGDFQGAAGTAFQAGDIQSGLDISKMAQGEKDQVRQTLARHIQAADTPEKYAAIVPILSRSLGPQFAQEYGDFSTRGQALAELGTDAQVTADQTRQDKATKAPDVVNINGVDNVWDTTARKFVPMAGGTTKPPDVVEQYDPVTHLPQKMIWDATQNKYVPFGGVKAPGKGISVTTNPDGTVTTEIGGTDAGGLGKTETAHVEQSQVQASEAAARIAGIMADFKPEYQQIGTRLQNSWASLKAKFDEKLLAPGEKEALSSYAAFRRKSSDNLSTYLHDMSGAAISPTEFTRLTQNQPNAGTGVFDGDDPITFKSKMADIMDQTQKALVRLNYYKTVGVPADLGKIPLTNVKNVEGKWYVKDDAGWFEVGAAP